MAAYTFSMLGTLTRTLHGKQWWLGRRQAATAPSAPMPRQVSVPAVCQLCAGLSQPKQHRRSSDCWSLTLQMELDRAETATQELLTAAEQLQKDNTQLSAENEVCKLLRPKGCIYCTLLTAHKTECRHEGTQSQHAVMYQSHVTNSGFRA